MLRRFRNYLNQPYPDKDDPASVMQGAFIAGLVVFFILFAFRPFGLHSAGEKIFFYCLLFGGISFLVTLVYEMALRYLLGIHRDTPAWTFAKWLVMVMGLLLLIALANYYVIFRLFSGVHSLWGFTGVLLSTLLVGIFPVTLFGALNMIRHLKTNQKIASAISSEKHQVDHARLVELPIHNSPKSFSIDSSRILFIEARQNYVYVVYEGESGTQKEMIRNTLTAIEKALDHTNIQRSHRSFLVNTHKIASISGNAQGLTLKIQSEEAFEVPVSRKYIPDFRE